MKIEVRRTETVATKTFTTICDLCGRDVENVAAALGSGTGRSEVEISASIGDAWGSDDDSREHYRADCCHECFSAKVVPSLEAIGLQVRKLNSLNRFKADNVVDETGRAGPGKE